MRKATLSQTDYPILKKISQTQYPKAVKISQNQRKTKVEQVLPFRVKFLPGTMSAYGPSSPAPIGIAVIGINNYIL
jgi:hypothetical protein